MRVGVIGAGAWGTTIAILLAHKGEQVALWSRDPERAARMQEARINARYLDFATFPENLRVTAEAIGPCDLLVGAVPTQFARAIYSDSALELPDAPFVSLSKGIEIATGQLPTRIFREVAGESRPTAVLTGPCIAREVALNLPTAVVVAGDESEMLAEAFQTPRFRVYTSPDAVGAELVGALKNVMGIAAGIIDGMQLGDNAKASLLTRGIVEIARLGTAMGAAPATFTGLAGFGDLFTTCVSPHGRNRTLGERLGRGEGLDSILASTRSVAEGVPTTRAVVALAEEHAIEMPITQALHTVLFEGVAVEQALSGLMERERRAE